MKVLRKSEVDTDNFEVGDVISFVLAHGEEAEAMAVKKEQDGMLFCFVNCLVNEYPMNCNGTNEGGYLASDLRNILNTVILDDFPLKLRNRMVPLENGDLLRIPTEYEVSGHNIYGDVEECAARWDPMKLHRNRIAFCNKSNCGECYWLMNDASHGRARSIIVDQYGFISYRSARYYYGVRPVFKLK